MIVELRVSRELSIYPLVIIIRHGTFIHKYTCSSKKFFEKVFSISGLSLRGRGKIKEIHIIGDRHYKHICMYIYFILFFQEIEEEKYDNP